MNTLLTVGAGVPVLTVAGAALYKLIRPRFSIGVNCWFCNHDTVVPFGNRNSWDCPACFQYNGFTSDGDYNKPIPAQCREELNHFVTKKSFNSFDCSGNDSGLSPSSNRLCETCNRNQQMKIRQLSQFSPTDEALYDVEVEAYANHLEQVYRLCRVCEASLREELKSQDDRIRSVMPQESATTFLSAPVEPNNSFANSSSSHLCEVNVSFCLRLLHVCCLVCSLLLLVFTLNVTSSRLFGSPLITLGVHAMDVTVLIGIFTQLLAAYTSKSCERLKLCDVVACIAWLVNMILFSSLPDSHVYSRLWLVVRSLVSTLNLVLSLVCFLSRRILHRRTREFRLM